MKRDDYNNPPPKKPYQYLVNNDHSNTRARNNVPKVPDHGDQ